MADRLKSLGVKRANYLRALRQVDADLAELARQEHEKGVTLRSVAKRCGVSHVTLAKWVRK